MAMSSVMSLRRSASQLSRGASQYTTIAAVSAGRAPLSQCSSAGASTPSPPCAGFRASSAHQVRFSSHSPMGAAPADQRKKFTLSTLRSLYKKGEPITVITAHDFPSAHVADHAGMDVILVGDSLAMVALGMEDTSEVLVEEMLLHCRSVARATKSAFTVSRLPSISIRPSSRLRS